MTTLVRNARHIEAVRKGIDDQERKGIPPAKVAAAIERALVADRPRARYLVGPDAQAVGAIARLPDRVRDAIVARLSGI